MHKNKPKRSPAQQAARAIHDKVTAVINTATIKNGRLRVPIPSLNEIAKYLTSNPPWMSLMDESGAILHMYFWLIKRALPAGTVDGKANEVLPTNERVAIISDFCQEIETFPKTYQIFFELPSVTDFDVDDLVLFSNCRIVKIRVNDDRFSVLENGDNALMASWLTSHLKIGSVYLCITIIGHATNSSQSVSAAIAISKVKQLLQLCNLHETGFVEAEWSDDPRPDASVVALETNHPKGPRRPFFISVAPEFTKFLASRIIRVISPPGLGSLGEIFALKNQDSPGSLLGLGKPPPQKPSASDSLLREIIPYKDLLSCGENDRDAERIHAGLEWSFDSMLTSNETQAFIHACIGIEAILGEDDQERGLTERLADRSSYLLGQTMSERKSIADSFKKIYKVRSQVVHGRRKRIGVEERKSLLMAQDILSRILRKETQMFSREN